MIRKLLICPYFGEYPSWFPDWKKSVGRLSAVGYDVLIDSDLERFAARARRTLGVQVPDGMYGSGKTWDYRAVLGVMYYEELKGYDFWGHTDFDCVYGRVERFVTDEFLDGLDIHSNHTEYMCGCWSLYRNTPIVNNLYLDDPEWGYNLSTPDVTAWVERSFSRAVEAAESRGEVRKVWNQWQAFTVGDLAELTQSEDGSLWLPSRLGPGEREVMMAHFRRTKQWPL